MGRPFKNQTGEGQSKKEEVRTMADKVIIGCKLPNGIILEAGDKKQVVKGLNSIVIIGATHATTEVDAEFYAAWLEEHNDFPAVKSGALFVARTIDAVKEIAKDREEDKTGFEPMSQDALGVKSADKD
jgi:hypothetical protein